ncbi:hypothetical protein GCM10009133_17270 [Cocleimonas flava]|uniref:Microsomal prostaglandin-E synthase 2 n=1 Tax=Cocleimonas flava TaxID=634765 RepID=A0A4R1ETU2_9GAMM|nr:glutathione S-transferase N-terminal domain-containing protein [Cocleimonas flava]TCJ84653.1 microsomal prostaglandin-E synthase 2 [Cocleimonas flava]
MITLYQFQSCPFCSKVRALLAFIKEPYEIVEVSPFGMKELDFTDHKKVPVLKDGDEVIVESATIIEHINNKYAKFTVDDKTKEWTDWIDQTLVHYLPPLIHPNFKTSLRNFQRIIKPGQFGWLKGKVVRFAGAIAMPKVARKMKDKYNIVDAEKEFLAAIDHWTTEGLKGNEFFGGEKPNYVDCSVFGVLNSCHELGVVKRAMQHSKAFALWYNRCHPLMT